MQGALFTTTLGQIFAFIAILVEFTAKFDSVSASSNLSVTLPKSSLGGLATSAWHAVSICGSSSTIELTTAGARITTLRHSPDQVHACPDSCISLVVEHLCMHVMRVLMESQSPIDWVRAKRGLPQSCSSLSKACTVISDTSCARSRLTIFVLNHLGSWPQSMPY